MARNPEELAEEMAAISDEEIPLEIIEGLEAWTKTSEGRAFTQELQMLHEQLVKAPTEANLRKIQNCQWRIYRHSLGLGSSSVN